MARGSIAVGASIALLLLLPPVTAAEDKAEAVIRAFLAAVDAGRVADAIAMLEPSLVEGDGAKEGWIAQLSAITAVRTVEVGSGEPDGPCLTYRVGLVLDVAPETAEAPIPYYGWDLGANTRWMELCPAGGSWAIRAIGTGP
jgi:hypothetical protein